LSLSINFSTIGQIYHPGTTDKRLKMNDDDSGTIT